MPIYTTDEMSIEEFTEMVRRHPVKLEPLPARFWEDERWLFDRAAELTGQYPDQWVAIYNQAVVGVGRSWSEANEAARARVGEVGPLVIFFLESKPYVY